MRRIFTLLVLSLLVFQVHALHHTELATLYDHVSDVNKEWLKKDITDDLLAPYTFHTDNDRIQRHLQLVEQRLRAEDVSHLSPKQAMNRKAMLDILHRYHQAKTFPVNSYHAERQPYFIDKYGTACAVGYLIIASGNGAIAEKVKQENNYAYIRELTEYESLIKWAEDFGFTLNELAWIQPGYQSHIPTKTLGSGTNGTVKDILRIGSSMNELYVSGNFTEAGGKACNGIARWDGSEWHALGNGLNGTINGIEMGGGPGMILAYGSFNNGTHQVATWDGNSWSFTAAIPNKGGMATSYVRDYHGNFLAGWYLENNVRKYYIARENTTWEVIEEFNGEVKDIIVHSNLNSTVLYAGGDFTQSKTGVTMNYIASMELTPSGSFEQVGTGLDNTVRVLYAYGNSVYAGGDVFDEQKNGTFGLAKYANGQWQQLIDLAVMSFDSSEAYVNTISYDYSNIYIGGKFFIHNMMYSGNNVAVINEVGNYASPYGTYSGTVNKLYWTGTEMYVGGEFTTIGNDNVNHIASLTTGVGIDGPEEVGSLHVFPNPAKDVVHLQWEENISSPQLEIYDISGKIIDTEHSQHGRSISISCSDMASGIYFYRLSSEGKPVAKGKMVITR